MAILSSFTLIRLLSVFHLTAAWFFLTRPDLIADQNVVVILGAAMRLPQATLTRPNEATSLIACLLTFYGLADLTAASLSDLVALEYWLSNIPVRLTMLFGLTGYIYLFKQDGMLKSNSTISASLCNSLTFTLAFFELTMWFWVYTSMRQERQEIAKRILQQQKKQDTMS